MSQPPNAINFDLGTLLATIGPMINDPSFRRMVAPVLQNPNMMEEMSRLNDSGQLMDINAFFGRVMSTVQQPVNTAAPLSDGARAFQSSMNEFMNVPIGATEINNFIEQSRSTQVSLPIVEFSSMINRMIEQISQAAFHQFRQTDTFPDPIAALDAFFASGHVNLTEQSGVPLARSQLLPRIYLYTVDDEAGFEQNPDFEHKECSICITNRSGVVLAEATDANCTMVRLPCNHTFDEACILAWFQRVNTCPNCRERVI